MDVLVRNIDPLAIKKIDELAKKKKISRAEYLRQTIQARAVLEAVNDTSDRYERLVQSMIQIVIDNTEAIEQVGEYMRKGEI